MIQPYSQMVFCAVVSAWLNWKICNFLGCLYIHIRFLTPNFNGFQEVRQIGIQDATQGQAFQLNSKLPHSWLRFEGKFYLELRRIITNKTSGQSQSSVIGNYVARGYLIELGFTCKLLRRLEIIKIYCHVGLLKTLIDLSFFFLQSL